MKQVLFSVLFALAALSVNAQSFKDTFDSNILGWTERSDSDGDAIIKDGVMHLQGKKNGSVFSNSSVIMTNAYTSFDPQKNFEIKCKAVVENINENPVGIIINYLDDYNYMLFAINEKTAYFYEFSGNNLVSQKVNSMNFKRKRNTELTFQIRSTYNKIEFIVN